MSEPEEASVDEIIMASFVVNARIYDVLMALLKEANPDAARDLLELHSQGHLLGTVPAFNGNFLTDIMNDGTVEE